MMRKYIAVLMVLLFSATAQAATKRIYEYTALTTPASNDYLLLSDSSDSNREKKVALSELFDEAVSGAVDGYFANLHTDDYVYFLSDDLTHYVAVAAGNNTANLSFKWPTSLPASGTEAILSDSLGNMSTADVVFGDNTLYSQDAEPATCAVGDLWVDTNGTSGQRFYTCESTNTWVAQAGGSGDNLGSAAASDVVALFNSGTCSGYLKSDGTCDTPSGAAHDAVTLGTDADVLLGLSTQQLTLDSQTANYFFAAPNGSAGDPTFRAIVAADIPTLNQNTTGTAAGLSGTPNITVGTISAGATGFSVDADGDVTAKTYLTSAADGARKSELPNNTSATPTGGGVEEIYNEGGQIKVVESDTEYNMLHSGDVDDTPDNGDTGTPPSENWAYDHAATASSDTVSGHVELATTAETTTGTDTGKAVTPDGLSGSVYGQKEIGWSVVASDTVTAVADGKEAAVIPASMNGMNLVDVTCSVHALNSAASGTTTVVIRRVRGATAADMTSTGVTIDYNAYTASDETVDTSNDDLATGDKLYVDINAVTSAVQKGLSCTAVFQTQ